MMDPVALKMLEYVPLPNATPAGFGFANNLVATPNPRTDAYDQRALKTDQVLTGQHRFSGRFVRGNRHETNGLNGYPTGGATAAQVFPAHKHDGLHPVWRRPEHRKRVHL